LFQSSTNQIIIFFVGLKTIIGHKMENFLFTGNEHKSQFNFVGWLFFVCCETVKLVCDGVLNEI
jgi:hypothetical protein